MYESLPLTAPATVVVIVDFTTPKSVSLTAPSREMSTLPGDTSRCTRFSGRPSGSFSECA